MPEDRDDVGVLPHDNTVIRTSPYQFARLELARFAAEEYLRTFWWFVLIIPSFGLVAVLFTDGILRAVGAMALLFPFTIPGRSMLATSKSSKLFTQPCFMEADDRQIAFYSEQTEPKRLRFVLRPDDVRDIVRRGDAVLVRTRRLGFAPVRIAAFATVEEERAFRELIEGMVEARLGE